MKKKYFILVFILFAAFVRCTDEKEAYYEEPDWLEPPIYNVLEEKGRFSDYLACVDRTLYAATMKEGGLSTVFAPNNEAFKVYLTQKGYASVNDIPQEEVEAIVAYSIVYSRYKFENLGDYFTKAAATDNVPVNYLKGQAVKRMTNYYPLAYRDPDFDNKWVVDSYIEGASIFFSYKYLPVFMQTHFSYSGLTAADYETFYPETAFAGANVLGGKILEADMKARNGIAHEISSVNYPLDNMDKFLREHQYSEFKSLLDIKTLSGEYAYKSYKEEPALAEDLKLIRPEWQVDKVYQKYYSKLAVDPSQDYHVSVDGVLDTEKNGHTLFVPTNEVLKEYVETRLLKYYDSLDELPIEAVSILLNAHMSTEMIWPSQFKTAKISSGEFLNGVGASGPGFDEMNILDKRLTSNGFIYTIDKVIKSKVLETLYSEIYLNPRYSLLNTAFINYYNSSLLSELVKSELTGWPYERYTMLLMSDSLLKADGYAYDEINTVFSNANVLSTTADIRLRRLMQMHLLQGYNNGVVDTEVHAFNTGGISQYDGWAFRQVYSGDVIRYKNNKVQACGNIEDGTVVTVSPIETFSNGTVYRQDKLLQYSPRESQASSQTGWTNNSLWFYLNKAGTENPQVSRFVDYLRVCLKSEDSDELSGISEENRYTVLMVNNTAINNAISQGYLPDISLVTGESGSALLKEKAAAFLRSHFLQSRAFVDDRLNLLYPYNVNEPDYVNVSTMYRVNNDALGLINQRTSVRVSKNVSTGQYVFSPQDVVVNGKTLIKAKANLSQILMPGLVSGSAAGSQNPSFRSNRIAGNGILHEFYGYFVFEVQSN